MKLIYPAIALDHSNPVTNKNQVGNYLLKSFIKNGFSTEIAYYQNETIKYLFGFKKIFYKILKNQDYIISREPLYLEFLSKKINNRINESDADFVFAFGTNPVAYLETNKPIFIICDFTFNNLLKNYNEYQNLPQKFIVQSHFMETMAFRKATKIFLASKYAVDDAMNYYKVDPQKLVQVPLGANIDYHPNENEIKTIIQKRLDNPLNLLMIGKNWHRKGFDIGIEIFKKVKQEIKNASLTIIGSKPLNKINEQGIDIIENIDKSNSEDMELFRKILEKTHIFLFPSRAEAFGHVVSEANAFGIPVIANNVGGIPSAIDEGVNGYLFDLSNQNGIDLSSQKIIELFINKTAYMELSINSYGIYSSKLNWNSIVQSIIYTIENSIKQ